MKNVHIIDIPLFEASPLLRRSEPRDAVVRRVDFCRFPRVCADGRLRRGFTHNLSAGGLCLRAEQPEPIGGLIRLTVFGPGGDPGQERLGRVAWTRPTGASEHLMGISLLADLGKTPLRIRYRRKGAATAA